MSTQIQWRKGTTAEHNTFTGALSEITVDTTKNTTVVHDGVTAGGIPQARQDGSNASGTWGISVSGNAATATIATNVTGGIINEARSSVAQHATTMNLWALPNVIDGTGAALTITAIANAPQAGASRDFYPLTGTILTQGATFDIDGAVSRTSVAGECWTIVAKTVSTYRVFVRKADGTAVVTSGEAQIQPISASVAASALTISASALSLQFRSTTLGSGTVTTVAGTPANLVISSGSTLGTVNAVQSGIAVLAINNAGTIELAAVNIAGGTDLSETGLISTTAEGGAGAADSATVIYSTTARTSVAYRVIGIIRSTQATAGTWATAPSLIQGAGGQALAAMSSLGYGQTWKNTTITSGVTYYNTLGKPKTIMYSGVMTTASLSIGGVSINVGNTTQVVTTTFIVPPGMSYVLTNAGESTGAQELS